MDIQKLKNNHIEIIDKLYTELSNLLKYSDTIIQDIEQYKKLTIITCFYSEFIDRVKVMDIRPYDIRKYQAVSKYYTDKLNEEIISNIVNDMNWNGEYNIK